MRYRNALAGILLAVLCQPSPAQEIKPGEEGALGVILAPLPGSRICWRRTYSKDHLARHPAQTVTDIEFRLAYLTFGPDEDYPEKLHSYMFQLLAKRRGSARRLQNIGNCWIAGDGRVFCGIECDGGGVYIRERDEGRKLLVSFDEMWGIALTDCGEETDEADAVALTPGKDDKSFLLDRIGDAGCPAYDNWVMPAE